MRGGTQNCCISRKENDPHDEVKNAATSADDNNEALSVIGGATSPK